MLGNFPHEILLIIGQHLDHEADFNALAQTSRVFFSIFNPVLYRHLQRLLDDEEPFPFLQRAAEDGKVASVRSLLRAGVPPGLVYRQTSHPATLAAERGHEDVVEVFLDQGIGLVHANNLIISDYYRSWGSRLVPPFPMPSLFIAAAESGHESVMRLLLRHTPEPKAFIEYWPEDALMLATRNGHIPVMKLLLELGWSACIWDGDTPLVAVAAGLELPVFRVVFEALSDSDLKEPEILRPMVQNAILNGNVPVMEFLIEKNIDPTIFIQGCEEGFGFQVSGTEGRIPCIIIETAATYPDMGQLLLEWVDVDAIISDCPWGMHDLMRLAVAVGSEDLAKRVLNAAHSDDQLHTSLVASGLFFAARYGHSALVTLLLDLGASPNGKYLPQYNVRTPLPIIRAICEGHVEVVKTLLGTEVDMSLQECLSILHSALTGLPSDAHDQILRLLLDRDAISNFSHLGPVSRNNCAHGLLQAAVGKDVKTFDLLCRHFHVALDRDNRLHQTAFVKAARRADPTVLKPFLEAGFDPNFISEPDSQHRNLVLLLAAASGRNHAAAAVQLLLQFGANVNIRDPNRNNMTALNILLWERKIKRDTESQAIKLLARNGADLLATDCFGNDALAICANRGAGSTNVPTIKALLECFDEQGIPFERFKGNVAKAAAAAVDFEVARVLWRYYWRKVHPV